jgi:hypothetical protein
MESKDVVRFLRLCHACNDLPTLDRAVEVLMSKRAFLAKAAGEPSARELLAAHDAKDALSEGAAFDRGMKAHGIKFFKTISKPQKGIPDASNN